MRVRRLHLFLRFAISFIFAIVLVACGGGDSDSPAPVTPTPPAGLTPPSVTPVAATVSVYAGALRSGGSRDGIGETAQFNAPADVAQDAAGNVYVADSGNHTIRKVAVDGTVTTLAGTAGRAGSADGTGANAGFNNPRGVAVDAAGNVFVSDTGNAALRRISPAGVVTTLATGLGSPQSIAVDVAGTVYFVDGRNVRKRAPDGTMTTFASLSGTGLSVAVDSGGNVYVAEVQSFSALSGAGFVHKFDSQGQELAYGNTGTGASAALPADISVDAAGNVYVASNGSQIIAVGVPSVVRAVQRISPDGLTRETVAGPGRTVLFERTVNGPLASARFVDPVSISVGPQGRIAVAESRTSAIRLIDTQQGTVVTLAGGDGGGYVDGPAASARFNQPMGLSATADGTLYVADAHNYNLRKISPTGEVSTIPTAQRGETADRPWVPLNVATAVNGTTLFVMQPPENLVGRSVGVFGLDGAARGAIGIGTGPFGGSDASTGLAVDTVGNLYLSMEGDVVVFAPGGGKRVLATGIQPRDLAVDAAGNVYFTSSFRTVGVISPLGTAVIRAGRPNEVGTADGAGTDARFTNPGALALDTAGNMYVADGTRIRKVTPEGNVSTITDLATVQLTPPVSVSFMAGLEWTNGALYATVRNAVLRIAPVN